MAQLFPQFWNIFTGKMLHFAFAPFLATFSILYIYHKSVQQPFAWRHPWASFQYYVLESRGPCTSPSAVQCCHLTLCPFIFISQQRHQYYQHTKKYSNQHLLSHPKNFPFPYCKNTIVRKKINAKSSSCLFTSGTIIAKL